MPAHHGTSQHPPVPARWAGWLRTEQSGQTRRSPCGGARLGCAGSTGSAVWPRWSRIRSMTAGCSMLAITRSCPPHCRQVSMSMANTRLRRCAHDIARCRSLTDTSPRAAEAAARVPGTIRARSRLAGANTPWYLVKCAAFRALRQNAQRGRFREEVEKVTIERNRMLILDPDGLDKWLNTEP